MIQDNENKNGGWTSESLKERFLRESIGVQLVYSMLSIIPSRRALRSEQRVIVINNSLTSEGNSSPVFSRAL